MSVQLYIYPQSFVDYDPSTIDYLYDGSFSVLNTSTQYTGGGVTVQSAINFYTPTLNITTWDRFGTGAVPTGGGGTITIPGGSGVIQRLSGLIPNSNYIVKITSPVTSIPLELYHYVGNVLQSVQTFPNIASAPGESELQFLCVTSNDILVWYNPTGSSETYSGFVINEDVPASVSKGQVMVDMYDFENVPLTLSVDNFQNAAEKTQSYSKAFQLPGSKRNNQIFKNVFDITATLDPQYDTFYNFNPYKKAPITLHEDGILIFTGFLNLIAVTTKDGQLTYKVNLYSTTITLKDKLADKKFYDLDFSELEHLYDKASIKDSWSGQLPLTYNLPPDSFAGSGNTTDVLKYPFVDWTHQAEIAPSGISATEGMPMFSNLNQMFRPFIKVKYIIQNILRDAGYTLTSTFMNSSYFDKVYMDFNWGKNATPTLIDAANGTVLWGYWTHDPSQDYPSPMPNQWATNSWKNLEIFALDVAGYQSQLLPNYDQSTNIYTATQQNEVISVYVFLDWVHAVGGGVGTDQQMLLRIIKNENMTGEVTLDNIVWNATAHPGPYSGQVTVQALNVPLSPGDTLQVQWRMGGAGSGALNQVRVQNWGGTNVPHLAELWALMSSNITNNAVLQTLRGKLGQWDFLKGLINMFNLLTVADPNNPNNIIIEPYDVIFPGINSGNSGGTELAARGISLDWTDKIDDKEITLKPLTTLKQFTNFKYKEDSNDYAAKNYKNAFDGYEYGSLIYDASYLNILTGKLDVTASPFAPTVTKPFAAQVPDLYSAAIYKLKDDGTSEDFDNKPRIMFDNGLKTLSTGTYFIPTMNGTWSENADKYGCFTTFSNFPIATGSYDLNYGTCQIIGQNNITTRNLYNIFWAGYYGQLYNPDTRIVSLKVNLTPSDINTFDFSSIVMLKNRAYRVNKINYKPGQLATVEFILLS